MADNRLESRNNAASPILLGNDEIAVFGSYGAGGARIRIGLEGSGYKATVLEQHKGTNGIASDQQTPIVLGDFIWCLMPENAGPLKKQLVCFNRSDLLKPVWSSGKENRFGRGLDLILFLKRRCMFWMMMVCYICSE